MEVKSYNVTCVYEEFEKKFPHEYYNLSTNIITDDEIIRKYKEKYPDSIRDFIVRVNLTNPRGESSIMILYAFNHNPDDEKNLRILERLEKLIWAS